MDVTLEGILDLVAIWKTRALSAEAQLRQKEAQENEELSKSNDPEERGVQQDSGDAVVGTDKRPDSDEPDSSE